MTLRSAFLFLALSTAPLPCYSLGGPQHVTFAPQPASFPLSTATLYVDPADWPSVQRAAGDLASDLTHVTGHTAELLQSSPAAQPNVVLIGTVSRSPLIDALVAAHKLDVSAIRNHWETSVTQIVEHPMPGVARALVLAGADKRGTCLLPEAYCSPRWCRTPVRRTQSLRGHGLECAALEKSGGLWRRKDYTIASCLSASASLDTFFHFQVSRLDELGERIDVGDGLWLELDTAHELHATPAEDAME